MCGRFAQAQTREDYLAYLADEDDRDEQLHLDPLLWSYAPGWWDKQPLLNARRDCSHKPHV